MYKMYFLVLYNLSPIQQGIQAGHAAVEYMLAYWHKKDCDNRATNDKTFIILNGGTTNNNHYTVNHSWFNFFYMISYRNIL